MSEAKYWVWYSHIFNSSERGERLLEADGSVESLYEHYRENPGIIGKSRRYSLVDALEVCELCRMKGWHVVTRDSEFYPEMFRSAAGAPAAIFVDGRLDTLISEPMVCIVGSRNAGEKGLEIAARTAQCLAEHSVCVVSGGARGVDTSAHEAALKAGGRTIVVLSCGLACNPRLGRPGGFYERVRENGAFVSERWPYEVALSFTFPKRNRILADFSRAVLVTEAGNKSGSLITAERAARQHRPVFSVPPEINPSDGCLKLLADGARPYYRPLDIMYLVEDLLPAGRLDESACYSSFVNYGPMWSVREKELGSVKKGSITRGKTEKTDEKTTEKTEENTAVTVQEKPERTETKITEEPERDLSGLSEKQRKVYSVCGDIPMNADEISTKTGLSSRDVSICISTLSLDDFLQELPGGRVKKKH